MCLADEAERIAVNAVAQGVQVQSEFVVLLDARST
jgi:hypothetical protein